MNNSAKIISKIMDVIYDGEESMSSLTNGRLMKSLRALGEVKYMIELHLRMREEEKYRLSIKK